jgi:N-methylhydantoinase B
VAAIPDGTYSFEDVLEDDGQGERNVVIESDGPHPEPGKFHRALRAGDRVRIETPGGGFGKPENN